LIGDLGTFLSATEYMTTSILAVIIIRTIYLILATKPTKNIKGPGIRLTLIIGSFYILIMIVVIVYAMSMFIPFAPFQIRN